MVLKFWIPTILCSTFPLSWWPLSRDPRILVLWPAACSERLQDIFDVIRADCSAGAPDAAVLVSRVFPTFVRIAITMTESRTQSSVLIFNYKISALFRLIRNSQMFRSFCKDVKFASTISLTAFTCFDQMLEPALGSALIIVFFTLPASIYYLE